MIESLHDLGLETRRADELGKQERGPEIREQRERHPQAQQARSRTLHVGDRLVARQSGGAEEDRVRLLRELQCRGG